jgi:hypothetical protein
MVVAALDPHHAKIEVQHPNYNFLQQNRRTQEGIEMATDHIILDPFAIRWLRSLMLISKLFLSHFLW